MVAVLDNFIASLSPAIATMLDVVGQILQLLLILGVLAYGALLYMYSIKINVWEHSKGNRVIASTTKAMKARDKKTGAPMLRLFGTMGFGGQVINQPPAECLVADKSRITPKGYSFILKDGLYHPVENIVLGRRVEAVVEGTDKKVITYTIQGSGIEINRDYNAELAIQNTLIEKATTYRNKKPTEVIASFALMIITIIVSGIVMYFAWTQFGNMAGAIASLREPLREGIAGAAQSIIGPG